MKVIIYIFYSLGDFIQAGKHLKASTTIIEKIYGEDSIEVAHELQKMAQIYFNGYVYKICVNKFVNPDKFLGVGTCILSLDLQGKLMDHGRVPGYSHIKTNRDICAALKGCLLRRNP